MANTFIQLRIERTVAYRGRVVIPGEVLVVDAKTADRMVERNLGVVVGEQMQDTGNVNADDELAGMTIDELKEYANEAGVDLTGKTKKAEIIAAIREAM